MLETIGKFVGSVAVYVTAVLGVIALYFLWQAVREWRAGSRAVFGVERDMATSEMLGALSRAGVVAVIALAVLGIGALGRGAEDKEPLPTQTPAPTAAVPAVATWTPAPTVPPTDTPPPELTDIPALPVAATDTPVVEPTPQTAVVIAFGGVWLRDAPNGGPIVVVPQDAVVELLEGREAAGAYEWQKVRILSVPLGSQAQVGQEGWIAFSPDFVRENP